MPDAASFDGHPQLQQAQRFACEAEAEAQIFWRNKSALIYLTSLGIETTAQLRRSTAARFGALDTEILSMLNECLVREFWAFFDPIVAFKERVDTSNNSTAFTEQKRPCAAHLRMRDLAYRHSYGGGKQQRMLGRDRISTLEKLLSSSYKPWDAPKENNPINYLIGAPWQGKSLMLTEVVAHAASQGHNSCGVGISFNGLAHLGRQNIRSISTVTSEFWDGLPSRCILRCSQMERCP